MNKIPLVDLSKKETEATIVREVGRVIRSRVFRDDLVIECPMSGRRQSTKICLECPHMQGIGKVKITPGQEEILDTQRYRVMCNYAMFRNLRPSSVPKDPQYKSDLGAIVDIHPRKPEELKKLEHALFVDGKYAVHCPINRANTGIWEVNNPPCPACQCYSGVRFVITEDKDKQKSRKVPQVACSHVKARTIHMPQSGSMKMLEGFRNGYAV